MAPFRGFVSGSYESRSLVADASKTINLYVETIEAADGKNTATLYGCPGLANWLLLPTSPIRGMWIGENTCYVVAGNGSGARLYQVLSNATYTDLGALGSVDTGTGPVQMYPNGNQLMILAGGFVFIAVGTSIIQPVYASAQGFVNRTATAVQITGGTGLFDASLVGSIMLISGVAYTVASDTDANNLVLAGGIGNESNVPYQFPNSGKVMVLAGGVVIWETGDQFSYGMYGGTIHIGGVGYQVASVQSPTQLTLVTSPTPAEYGYYMLVSVTASCGCVLDGYFIVATPNTKQFNWSAPNDGTQWDPADFAIKEGYPDNIAGMLADHEVLYLFGTQTIEVWQDTGAFPSPFQRSPGAFMHLGLVAPSALVRGTLSQTVAWLGGDPQGQTVAYHATGYQPQRFSTHAEEYAWSQYATTADAEGFPYTLDGHQFWQINFPTANTTWVWDASEKLWHQRAYSGGGRHRARCHGYVWGMHLVGDYSTGQLYIMSNTLYTDAGAVITCTRRAPHVSSELKRARHSRFRLEMEPATGLAITLNWSNDGSKDFVGARNPDVPIVSDDDPTQILGQEWRRLGIGRDRVYEVVLSATSRIAIINADLEVS